MPPDDVPAFADFRLLHEASRALLGYFVHTWFNNYLVVVSDSVRSLHERGLIKNFTEATEQGTHTILFDFGAIDLEKLSYINGIYFYILACHKSANHRLMNRTERKQVLYLRGYDFEGSISGGQGVAAGYSTTKTSSFNITLAKQLAADCTLFKVASSKDVYWETAAAQRHFSDNFADLIPYTKGPILSFYLNALHWQEDIERLFDRMDHFVVYVSSVTRSALWELEQLDTDARRGRVTVIFDAEAIRDKAGQMNFRDRMQQDMGERVIWAKEGEPEMTPEALRQTLERKFLVVTPEAFVEDIEAHRRRIAESTSTLPPGEREMWLDFRFMPGLDAESLAHLRGVSEWLGRHIAETGPDMASLPLFLCHIQLRIYTTLLFGEHHQTGKALAAYAAVMQGTLDYYRTPGEKPGALSAENRDKLLATLAEHFEAAEHIGKCHLKFGRSHEFDDFRALAKADYDAAFNAARGAVSGFFTAVLERAQNLKLAMEQDPR